MTIEIPGIVFLVLASLLSAAAVFNAQAASLGPLATLVTRRRFYLKVGLWSTAVPLVAAAVALMAATLLATGFLQRICGSEASAASFVVWASIAVAVTGAVFAGACGLLAARTATHWQPVRD